MVKVHKLERLLNIVNKSSNVGDYLHTSSLGSIIELEKQIIGSDEKIKCLRLNQQILYGDLKIFK